MPDITENVEKSANTADEKKRIKAERKQLKAEQKQQKKEAKKKAKELALQEADIEDEEEGNGVPVVLITFFIVIIWVAILCVLIKLDVGGFGSGVLAPLLKDVPVINKVLPNTVNVEEKSDKAAEEYSGYEDLRDAVDQIKVLELELEKAQNEKQSDTEEIEELRAEVERLSSFEKQQVEFERIKNEFYNEVIYAEKGPGAEEYRKYYEAIDPAAAEELYKQVVQQLEEDSQVEDYAKAYSEMKPAQAAGIFEQMGDNLDLAAKILNAMPAENRGKILGAMDPEIAARLTKIMDPEY
ncbi:MAG: hypothetical protein GX234_10205 [Clostridiales bacterium]|nr:hypothetical protein [Clostridiales bacterium]